MKIVLASKSPYRQKILSQLGLAFDVCPSRYEEIIKRDQNCEDQVKIFSLGKALEVSDRLNLEEDHLIIGVDTMVEVEGETLGKPLSVDEAKLMLQSYAGKKQKVITGVSLKGSFHGWPVEHTFTDTANVFFSESISETALDSILATGEWKGKCGGYSVVGWSSVLIDRVEGDYNTIIGLPVKSLVLELESLMGGVFWDVFDGLNIEL